MRLTQEQIILDYQTTRRQLEAADGISNPNYIQVGQLLNL